MNNIWLIGLAVMWQNLVRNIARNWFSVSVYNRTSSVTDEFIAQNNNNIHGYNDLTEFVKSLETPRKIIIMVKAGDPVRAVIDQLVEIWVGSWDIIMDCGNSYWEDTEARAESLKHYWINYIGCGVSGWEEGALNWPSIMPWISNKKSLWSSEEIDVSKTYSQISPILEKIAAKDFEWNPCVTFVWNNWAGHFVKMIHNGIEYAIMQMIAESYKHLKDIYWVSEEEKDGLTPVDLSNIFKEFNKGKLNCYLIEITGEVLAQKDEFIEGAFLVDMIKDTAGAKWTGLWTSLDGLNNQIDVSSIIAATYARVNSSKKELRNELSKLYSNKFEYKERISLKSFIPLLENALYIWMVLAYAQGLALIQKLNIEHEWNINLSEVVRIWQGGCIIRSELLKTLQTELKKNNNLENILFLDFAQKEINKNLKDLNFVITESIEKRIATPTLSSALEYFYSITEKQSNANLIQGMRDYFGAHTYERVDREWIFHTKWDFF